MFAVLLGLFYSNDYYQFLFNHILFIVEVGWRASVSPADHPVSQYEFDVLIGADGKRNTLEGFKRKEFRGKLAIAITANFINRRTEAEARVQEISGKNYILLLKLFGECTFGE